MEVLNIISYLFYNFPGGSDGKESACNAEDLVWSLGREDPWRREWLPTPVFLPGECYGQRSLVNYSPQGLKESDMTKWITLHYFIVGLSLSLVAKSCPMLVTPWTVACQAPLYMGFFQARILEWVAISFSRGSSQPRNRTQVFCIAVGQ